MPSPLSTPAAPASLPRGELLRLWVAIRLGDAAALASRLAGRGSGASIRGQVLTRIAPDAFADLLQGRRVLAVSGTNGKTTTTHLLAAAVRVGLGRDADRVVTNADGANLHYGIASALSQRPRSDIAVLETDERVVSDMIAHARPEILVLLNFSRDQLDRHHEIKALGRSWRIALETAAAAGPTIIANSCDPLVVWSAGTAARVVWVETATVWNADGALCPACGTVLRRSATAAGERWDCPGCELTQPDAAYRVDGDRIVLPNGTSVHPDLQVPGSFNVSNAACALAAAVEFGVPATDALAGMHTVTAPAGRFATTHFGRTRARLLLAKNPAGWAEALPLATSDPVVLAIDSVAADGKDVSWLWDVEYEQLAGRHVVCTGPRAQDLAVRLSYAGVDHEVEPDLRAALGDRDVPVDVIATYTPFQKLLKMAGLR
ncbi:MAG: MurT ligase domain-containing protein [Propionicimonas sp.]|uniref:MurT ligase domain-containing protein n=1 Tax=Propionicimonas sp. TaxID=1955623 RepID=UPI003D106622